LKGVPVTVVDTAGVRGSPTDAIEAEGIARAVAARSVAAVVLVVLDGSMPLTDDDRTLLRETAGSRSVIVANKADLGEAWSDGDLERPVLRLSALTGEGLEALRAAIVASIRGSGGDRDVPAVTNMRHVDLLGRARASLERAAAAAAAGVPEEFVLADLNEARGLLEEITGARTPDDVLGRIFQTFCIGK
jgi:tRNA modification GTPase